MSTEQKILEMLELWQEITALQKKIMARRSRMATLDAEVARRLEWDSFYSFPSLLEKGYVVEIRNPECSQMIVFREIRTLAPNQEAASDDPEQS